MASAVTDEISELLTKAKAALDRRTIKSADTEAHLTDPAAALFGVCPLMVLLGRH
jgi:hypothetical protein